MSELQILTIGHSNHPFGTFLGCFRSIESRPWWTFAATRCLEGTRTLAEKHCQLP